MAKIINQSKELYDLIYEKSARLIYDLLNKIAIAKWKGNTEQEQALLFDLADMMASARGYADILGRRRVLLRTQRAINKFTEADSVNPIIPNIPFQEAIDDLVSRMPVLAKSAEEIKQIYTTEHSFAVIRSANLKMTERIQEAIGKAMKEGKPINTANDLIAQIGDWNYAYADTVYRTNLNTSYHAGQFQIMKSPEIREILPAFRFVAIIDGDVRPNHKAMHGIIASMDDEIWQKLSPPLGYKCRCSLVTMDAIELKQRGINPLKVPKARIPVGAFPDSFGFGRRSDMDIYGY